MYSKSKCAKRQIIVFEDVNYYEVIKNYFFSLKSLQFYFSYHPNNDESQIIIVVYFKYPIRLSESKFDSKAYSIQYKKMDHYIEQTKIYPPIDVFGSYEECIKNERITAKPHRRYSLSIQNIQETFDEEFIQTYFIHGLTDYDVMWELKNQMMKRTINDGQSINDNQNISINTCIKNYQHVEYKRKVWYNITKDTKCALLIFNPEQPIPSPKEMLKLMNAKSKQILTSQGEVEKNIQCIFIVSCLQPYKCFSNPRHQKENNKILKNMTIINANQ